jgi:membrane-associated phospholipid phosphatase
MGLAGAGNLVITYLLKESIKRQRPFERYTEIHAYDSFAHGFSMPSGHSATAFNLASSLSLEFPKWYIILPSYAYAAWVAYSRIQLGVHYPSDVYRCPYWNWHGLAEQKNTIPLVRQHAT